MTPRKFGVSDNAQNIINNNWNVSDDQMNQILVDMNGNLMEKNDTLDKKSFALVPGFPILDFSWW